MKLPVKSLFAALLMALSFNALADDQSIAVATSGITYFTVDGTALSGGSDLLTLTGLDSGSYNVTVSLSGQGLSLTDSSNLNGVSASVTNLDTINVTLLGVSATDSGTFLLNLFGTTTSSTSGYTGTITVSAVPEPETYGMLLAGLAAIGFMARRRRPSQRQA